MGKRVNLSKIEKPVKDDNNSDGTVTLTGEELRIFLNVLHKIDDNLMGLATLNHNVRSAKLLQKSGIRKNEVIELIYRGFI